MPDTFEQLLDRAAAQSGIEPGYWDIWGRYHHTTTAAKQAILEALGTAAANPDRSGCCYRAAGPPRSVATLRRRH